MLPATDPADAVTAPLVCYESSSGDEGALQGDQLIAQCKDSAWIADRVRAWLVDM